MEKNKTPGIYAIINLESNKMYIGSSSNIEKRFKAHQASLKAGNHYNKDLQTDYNSGATFQFKIIKKLPTDIRAELMEQEAAAINQAKTEGKELYNLEVVYPDHYLPKSVLKDKIVNLYCMEHFGKLFYTLTNGAPAKINLLYELLDAKTEEEKKGIKDKYKSVIEYQNKKESYKILYGLDYDKIAELPEEEKKEEIRKAKERKKKQHTKAHHFIV